MVIRWNRKSIKRGVDSKIFFNKFISGLMLIAFQSNCFDRR